MAEVIDPSMQMTLTIPYRNATNFTLTSAEVIGGVVFPTTSVTPGAATMNQTCRMSQISSLDVRLYTPPASDETLITDDAVKVIFVVNGIEKWYDGSEWVTSDGSFAQANPIGELTGEELAYMLTASSDVAVKVWVDNTAVKFGVDWISVTFANIELEPTEVQLSEVYGYVKGIDERGVEGVTVIIKVIEAKDNMILKAGDRLVTNVIQLQTDGEGYWSTKLFPSSAFEGGPLLYTVRYVHSGQDRRNVDKKTLSSFTVPAGGGSYNVAGLITVVP